MFVLERILRHPLAALLAAKSLTPDVHVVGGIVRDAVLGKATRDLDLSVAAGGDALARELAEQAEGTSISLGGDRFSSYRVVADGFQADIWDRRGGSLVSDLERRDLTLNAIACAFDGRELTDPFGGLEDLKARTLRATKPDCFVKDPLRVLRLARFRLSLENFTIDPATAAAARAAASGLEDVARERVRDEFTRILAGDSLREAFEILRQLDALDVLLPPLLGVGSVGALLARGDRLDRFLRALEPIQVGNTAPAAPGWRDEDRWQAALGLLVGAVAGTDLESGAAALESRGLAPRKILRSATRLASNRLPTTEPSRRLFLDRHRRHWPLALAVVAAASTDREPPDIARVAAALAETSTAHPDLVAGLEPFLDGHAAAAVLGVSPGPALGKALNALSREQALGFVRTRDEAEEFLRSLRTQSRPKKPAGRAESRSISPKPPSAG